MMLMVYQSANSFYMIKEIILLQQDLHGTYVLQKFSVYYSSNKINRAKDNLQIACVHSLRMYAKSL